MLAEVTVYDPVTSANRVLRFSTGAYSHASAPGFYRDAILERSRFRREIFADGLAFGASSNDYGRLLVANLDGSLDWLIERDCAADGRPIRLLIGDQAAPYSAFAPVFSGRVGQMLVGLDQVEFRILDDFAALLDQPVGLQKFAGSNVLPNGLEGVADLKDQWVPVGYGTAFNVPAPCCNTSKLIYCVADRAVDPLTVTAVRDRGALLVQGVQRASVAALEATSPAAGTWDFFPGNATTPAYIRLGSMPVGDVTATITTGTTAAARTTAQLFRRILAQRAGVPVGSISSADLAALDAANGAEVGFWATGETSRRECLDFLAGSVGAGYWQDAAGTWRIRRIEAPAGTPVVTFAQIGLGRPGRATDADLIKLEPLFTSREDAGLPIRRAVIRYGRNHTVQNRDALAGVALSDLQRLSAEWLERSAESAEVQALHPMAGELTADTAYATEAAAALEASRRLTLFGVTRRRFSLTARLTPAMAAGLDLGAVVKVEHDRFGLQSGKSFLITAIEFDVMSQIAELVIWG